MDPITCLVINCTLPKVRDWIDYLPAIASTIAVSIAVIGLLSTFCERRKEKKRNEEFKEKVFMYDLRCNLDYVNDHIKYITSNLEKKVYSVKLSYLDDRLVNRLLDSSRILDLPTDVIQRIFAVGNKMAAINKIMDSLFLQDLLKKTFSLNNNNSIEKEVTIILGELYQLRDHLKYIFIDLGEEATYIKKMKAIEDKPQDKT